MRDKKAPSDDDRNYARWLRAELDAVLEDDAHPGWAHVHAARLATVRPDRQADKVAAILSELRFIGRCAIDPVTLDNLLLMLRESDDAFADLTPAMALRELKRADLSPRAKIGGNGARGPWNVLVRLAHKCGALGCDRIDDPGDEQIEATRNRLRRGVRA